MSVAVILYAVEMVLDPHQPSRWTPRYGTSTAAPVRCPSRRSERAQLASSSGYRVVVVWIRCSAASARNSRASVRVKFATERSVRSPQSREYRKAGMSLMWIPPQTTVPPGLTALNASGTKFPTGAKIIAASSSRGAGPSEGPAQIAPIARAKFSAFWSPGRTNA